MLLSPILSSFQFVSKADERMGDGLVGERRKMEMEACSKRNRKKKETERERDKWTKSRREIGEREGEREMRAGEKVIQTDTVREIE
jgi:hypothetical protein